MKSKYVRKIDSIEQISAADRAALKKVTDKFAFFASEYYLSLIDWSDPEDPIRRLIIPDMCELDKWGELDASKEHSYTVLPGLQHRPR